ncbi:MAG: FAD-binding protein, partial [Clostridiales bacterium]
IGGGLAGCFAAVTARENGAEVILADKNYCGKTGSSHYARDMMVFREEWGDNFQEWMSQFVGIGEYINNQEWVEILLRESYDRYRDLVSWGVPFYRKGDIEGTPGEEHPYGNAVMSDQVGLPEEEEEPFRYHHQKTKYRKSTAIIKFGERHKMMTCRNKVLSCGATILDRIMLTDLIKKDGKVIGAVGFDTQTGDFYVIEAKAVVVAVGGLSFRPAYYGIHANTGEGVAMGYRAGADLVGMEFGNGLWVSKDCDCACLDGPVAELGLTHDAITNGLGEEFLDSTAHLPTNIHWSLEVHKGNGPIYHEAYGYDRNDYKEEIEKYNKTAEGPWITMMDRVGVDIFNNRFEQYMALEGNMFPGGISINTKCESTVPGLYAAGDACGNNFTGPTYGTLGSAMCNAAVTGHRSGENAAKYALDADLPKADEQEIIRLRQIVIGPLERGHGFKPEHVLLRVHQNILPYEIRQVMHEKRLKAALTMFEFFRDHMLPRTFAVDPHDLRNFHEVRSIVLGGEIMLRTALFRTESRGGFFREDYPRRDDKNWLKWVLVRQDEQGQMQLDTEDVPKEWQGDLDQPYTERYLLQYGYGEEE